jgi:hypothetical protein
METVIVVPRGGTQRFLSRQREGAPSPLWNLIGRQIRS